MAKNHETKGSDIENNVANGQITERSHNSKCDIEPLNLMENQTNRTEEKCDNTLVADRKDISISKPDKCSIMNGTSTVNIKSGCVHSRQSSDSCYTSSSSNHSDAGENHNPADVMTITELGNCRQGNIVGLHRKMVSQSEYYCRNDNN